MTRATPDPARRHPAGRRATCCAWSWRSRCSLVAIVVGIVFGDDVVTFAARSCWPAWPTLPSWMVAGVAVLAQVAAVASGCARHLDRRAPTVLAIAGVGRRRPPPSARLVTAGARPPRRRARRAGSPTSRPIARARSRERLVGGHPRRSRRGRVGGLPVGRAPMAAARLVDAGRPGRRLVRRRTPCRSTRCWRSWPAGSSGPRWSSSPVRPRTVPPRRRSPTGCARSASN